MSEPILMGPNWSFRKSDVAAICKEYGPQLVGLPDLLGTPGPEAGPLLMWSFALTESFHLDGELLGCEPRFEPAYYYGGKYCIGRQQQLCTLYDKDGSKSYGNWQVMLVNCPIDLQPEYFRILQNGARAFVHHVNQQVARQKPQTLDEIADLYNSGSWRDRNVPWAYMARLKHFFVEETLS